MCYGVLGTLGTREHLCGHGCPRKQEVPTNIENGNRIFTTRTDFFTHVPDPDVEATGNLFDVD